MASKYYDIFHVTVEQFAYLKCPSKIRAALINAGGPRLSHDAIQRKLDKMPTTFEGAYAGDPQDCDAVNFRVAGLVKNVRPKAPAITDEDRKVIAKLAQGIGDRKDEKPKLRYRQATAQFNRTAYADRLIDEVCEATSIPREIFISLSRHKYICAARSLVVRLLRERNPSIYSYPRIAEILGRNDHSTMIHSFQRFEDYCADFPIIAEVYQQMRKAD